VKRISRLTFITLCLWVSFMSQSTTAQTICSDPLPGAYRDYSSGNIQSCIDNLLPCLSSIKDKTARFEAYRLLAISYHTLNQENSCDTYLRLMLLERPEYILHPNIETGSFAKLLSNYGIKPKLSIGLHSGMNINFVHLIKSYSPNQLPQLYTPSIGYQLGVFGTYELRLPFYFKAGLTLASSTINQAFKTDDGFQQNYAERLQYLNSSLGAFTHGSISKKLRLHGGLNVGFSFLQQAKVSVSTRFANNEEIFLYSQDGLQYRNKLQPNMGIELGIDYRINRSLISLSIAYSHYFQTTIDSDKRLLDQDFIMNTEYVNDDLKMRLLHFKLAYTFALTHRVYQASIN